MVREGPRLPEAQGDQVQCRQKVDLLESRRQATCQFRFPDFWLRTYFLAPAIHVSAQLQSVSVRNIANAPRLTPASTFPRPSSRSRVSALRHNTTATNRIALHDTAHGRPG